MPVDKFEHTDSSSVQRVTAGGVTLTQINNTFMRLDVSKSGRYTFKIVPDIERGKTRLRTLTLSV